MLPKTTLIVILVAALSSHTAARSCKKDLLYCGQTLLNIGMINLLSSKIQMLDRRPAC